MVVGVFMSENDEVEQAVLSKKNTLTVLYVCDGIVVCIVICLLEEFIEKPHILSHFMSD